MSITIGPNAWPGFTGLFYLNGRFRYIINNAVYYETDLRRHVILGSRVDLDYVLTHGELVPAFNIDPQGSEILIIQFEDKDMLYQQQSDGQFVELLPRQGNFLGDEMIDFKILKIPLPNGIDLDGQFEVLPLHPIDNTIVEERRIYGEVLNIDTTPPITYDQVLHSLNNPQEPEITPPPSPRTQAHNDEALRALENLLRTMPRLGIPNTENIVPSSQDQREEDINPLFKQSYETLLKQLYDLPVEVPEYLIVNGLRVSFIPFQQISQMLSQNQIERYILDPMLQPWVGPPNSPNRIVTMFGKNGITYLIKARYDPQSNQIYPPM